MKIRPVRDMLVLFAGMLALLLVIQWNYGPNTAHVEPTVRQLPKSACEMTVAEAREAIQAARRSINESQMSYQASGFGKYQADAEIELRNVRNIYSEAKRCHGYTDKDLGVDADDIRSWNLK